MRKNSPKEKSQRLRASIVRAALALLVVGLLVAPIAVQAELQATRLAYSWDINSDVLELGQVTVEWDGSWIPLLHVVDFNGIQWSLEDHPDDPPPCADPTETTQYVGWVEYGLPYLDNDPLDAMGFRETKDWTLIDCDLNRDGTWDDDDLEVGPLLDLDGADSDLVLARCGESAHCQYLWWDAREDCEGELSNFCSEDISTKLWISVDIDCDGIVDSGFPVDEDGAPERLCVYGEALTPDYGAGDDIWTFPLGVRISDSNGAKTLMLLPNPTAVGLASFSIDLEDGNVMLRWETATELDNVGFNVYRAEAGGSEPIQINDWLIPSQDPGSTVGSRYQFVDHSAQPGMAYEYWLQDIDLGGTGTMNGPVAVQIPRARRLPCRPRPAPMPGQWE